jgi:protein-tyrosine-phosphatase
MAEAIAKKWLEQEGITNVHVESAGIEAIPGWFAAQNAIAVCAPYLNHHEAQQVSHQKMHNADVVFCVAVTQMEHLLHTYEQHAAKVFPLALDGSSVEDPFGRDLAEYVRIYSLMETYVHQRMRELFYGQL